MHIIPLVWNLLSVLFTAVFKEGGRNWVIRSVSCKDLHVVSCDSRWHVKAFVGNMALINRLWTQGCACFHRVSSSHPWCLQERNSIPFTFRNESYRNDPRKVVELQVHAPLSMWSNAETRANSIHSTGALAQAGCGFWNLSDCVVGNHKQLNFKGSK